MTITPPLWGVLLGSALVIWLCFRHVAKQEAQMELEQMERDVLAGLPQRHRRIPTQEIEADDVPG